MKSKPVEFQIPEGFRLPEGTEPGSDFDLVCSFRIKNGNKMCLVELGDFEMPGYEDKDEARPQYGTAKEMMTAQMPSESMMGGE